MDYLACINVNPIFKGTGEVWFGYVLISWNLISWKVPKISIFVSIDSSFPNLACLTVSFITSTTLQLSTIQMSIVVIK